MNIINGNSDNFEEEVLKDENRVLVDFYADWCMPCNMIAPIIEKIAQENQSLKIVRINTDNEMELSMKYDIMSIPTLVIIKNGEEKDRIVGVVSKSEIEDMINKY